MFVSVWASISGTKNGVLTAYINGNCVGDAQTGGPGILPLSFVVPPGGGWYVEGTNLTGCWSTTIQ